MKEGRKKGTCDKLGLRERKLNYKKRKIYKKEIYIKGGKEKNEGKKIKNKEKQKGESDYVSERKGRKEKI